MIVTVFLKKLKVACQKVIVTKIKIIALLLVYYKEGR